MRLRTLLICGVLIGTASAADPTPAGDLGRMQGRWEASVGKRRDFSVILEVKGSEVAATISPKVGPKLKASGALQLDEAAKPRSLDWVDFATPDGVEVPRILSIYRLEGDRLILRSGGFNDVRPRSFEPGGEGVWTDVLVFRRPTAEDKAPAVSSSR